MPSNPGHVPIPFFYFFSSNSRTLYLQNMLNVLALPEGSRHRVRYDISLVPDYLRKQSNPGGYKSSPILVILVAREADCKDETTRFYPLRRGKLVDLFWEGDILFADYTVGEYVDWRVPGEYDFRILARKRHLANNGNDQWIKEASHEYTELMFTKFYPNNTNANTKKAIVEADQRWIFNYISGSKVSSVLSERIAAASEDKVARLLEGLFYNLLVEKFSKLIKDNIDENSRPCSRFISRVEYPAPAKSDGLPSFLPFANLADSTEAWQAIVEGVSGLSATESEPNKTIAEVKDFGSAIFYRVIGLNTISYSSRSGSAEPPIATKKSIPLSEPLPGKNGYILESGHDYTLDLIFYHSKTSHGSDLSETDQLWNCRVVPRVDKNFFAFEPEPIPITFRYDKRAIDLTTVPTSRDSYSVLRIDPEPATKSSGDDSIPPTSPSLLGPQIKFILKFKEHRLRRLAFWMLIVAQLFIWYGTNFFDFSTIEPVYAATNSPSGVAINATLSPAATIPPSPAPSPTSTPTLASTTTAIAATATETPSTGGSTASNTQQLKQRRLPFPLMFFVVPETLVKPIGYFFSLLGALLTPIALYLLLGKIPGT